MAHFEELYPNRFLKGVTLSTPKTIRILGFVGEMLEGEDGAKEKAVLRYRDKEGEGEIVWCKTNAILTSKLFGDDYTQWAGHLVTIWYDPTVALGKEKVGGIRVYGSPEIALEMRVGIKRPRRKKEEVFILRPTGKAAPAGETPPQPTAHD